MRSAVYEGKVHHERYAPTPHRFSFPLSMMYLDLDEIAPLFSARRGFSCRGPAPIRFCREDYFGDPRIPLADALRKHVERESGTQASGPIAMLTHPRYWGFVFNPVTLYYCFDATGKRVETIVADVTNIPWRERHAYVVPYGQGRATLDKAFYVSPYLPMSLGYEWTYRPPDDDLSFRMDCRDAQRTVFSVELVLRRREFLATGLERLLVHYPWSTARVVAGIYWQAFRLRRKKVPVFERNAAVLDTSHAGVNKFDGEERSS